MESPTDLGGQSTRDLVLEKGEKVASQGPMLGTAQALVKEKAPVFGLEVRKKGRLLAFFIQFCLS